MAGRTSVDRVQRRSLRADCAPCSARFVTVGTIKNPEGTRRLKAYWTKGKGALKIRWGTDGSYKRCVRLLRKYFPKDPFGLCANLEKQATGHWPAEKIIPS